MDLLGGYGSSGEDDEPPPKSPLHGEDDDGGGEEENSGGGGGGSERKRARTGGATRGERLKASLDRLLRESAQLPNEERATERSAKWDLFEGVCRAEFAEELRGAPGGGLVVFGSWTYNMWVVGSDIDVNVGTPERIKRFFPRLKAAVTAADPSSTVEMVPHAQVPLARVCVRGLQIDVTHEAGEGNGVAAHHVQVRDWARRWQGDEVVCTCVRIIKLWATSRDVHSPKNNTLNSMGYMLMLLAIASPPPGTHAPKAEEDSGGSGGGGDADVDAVSDLLTRFFSTYAATLRPGVPRAVIHAPHAAVRPSPSREADVYRLSQHACDKGSSGFGTTMLVQDPFLEEVNVARFVDARSFRRLGAAFLDARGIMREGAEDAYQQLVRRRRLR